MSDNNEKFVAPLSEMEELIRASVEGGGEFRMITAGISMMPLLRNRKDTVVLVKAEKPLKKYDIPLYKRRDGHYVLHRIVNVKNGIYTMRGDNQFVSEYGIEDKDVIAVVSGIIRDGKTICLKKSLRYRLYVFFRIKLFPLRYFAIRCASFIKRRILHIGVNNK